MYNTSISSDVDIHMYIAAGTMTNAHSHLISTDYSKMNTILWIVNGSMSDLEGYLGYIRATLVF